MTVEDACYFFRFDDWTDRIKAQEAKETWEGQCTMPRESVIPDICQHIDLFWHDKG